MSALRELSTLAPRSFTALQSPKLRKTAKALSLWSISFYPVRAGRSWKSTLCGSPSRWSPVRSTLCLQLCKLLLTKPAHNETGSSTGAAAVRHAGGTAGCLPPAAAGRAAASRIFQFVQGHVAARGARRGGRICGDGYGDESVITVIRLSAFVSFSSLRLPR